MDVVIHDSAAYFNKSFLRIASLLVSFFTIGFVIYAFGVLFELSYVSSLDGVLPLSLSGFGRIFKMSLPTRIFCIILTTNKNLNIRAKAVNQTWASQCDKHFFIAIVSNGSNISQEFYDPLPVLQPSHFVIDQYKLLTDKMYRTFVDVYAKYNDYDWYLKGDDDTYIFMDNLRKFLKDKDRRKPVTYGYDFSIVVKNGFHSGGAGYLLSNEAFNKLGSTLKRNFTFCPNSGREDVDVAKCLRLLNVNPERSIDETGKQRFLPLNVRRYFQKKKLPSWLYRYSADPPQKGINCCSENLISMHYMTPGDMLKMHMLYENFKVNLKISKLDYAKNSTLLPFMSLLHKFMFERLKL